MKIYGMVQGYKASYSLRFYFVLDGLIYIRHKNIDEALECRFKNKCVDVATKENIRSNNGIY